MTNATLSGDLDHHIGVIFALVIVSSLTVFRGIFCIIDLDFGLIRRHLSLRRLLFYDEFCVCCCFFLLLTRLLSNNWTDFHPIFTKRCLCGIIR